MRRIYEFEIPRELVEIRIAETKHPDSIRFVITDVDEYKPVADIVIPHDVWKQMHEITDGYRAYQSFTYTEAQTTETSNPTTPTDPDQS